MQYFPILLAKEPFLQGTPNYLEVTRVPWNRVWRRSTYVPGAFQTQAPGSVSSLFTTRIIGSLDFNLPRVGGQGWGVE